MYKPELYREKAQQCLREAENAPEALRLELITIAQHWYELASHVERVQQGLSGSGNQRQGTMSSEPPS
jgi:hypothetical protein